MRHIGLASDFRSVMVAVGRSNPTGGSFINKFIFPEFICLTDILSDFLPELVIVKTPNDNHSYCNTIQGRWRRIKSCEFKLQKRFHGAFLQLCKSFVHNLPETNLNFLVLKRECQVDIQNFL